MPAERKAPASHSLACPASALLQTMPQQHTSYAHAGDVNVELHCDMAPRTCENFIALCGQGYYDNTRFHRSIKNFMIQVRHWGHWGTGAPRSMELYTGMLAKSGDRVGLCVCMPYCL